jgi:hypothetical protein
MIVIEHDKRADLCGECGKPVSRCVCFSVEWAYYDSATEDDKEDES